MVTNAPLLNNQPNNTATQNTGNANNNTATQNTGKQATGNSNNNTNLFNFGNNNATGNDSFNQSKLNSFVAGSPKGSLSLASQPIESLFSYLDGIDGNNINSNQNLFSAATNLLSLFLNPQSAGLVNAAAQNGTLQQLINQTLEGQGTNTANQANGNATTAGNGADAQNGQQAATTQAAQQPPQASTYGANGQFQLSATFLKNEALELKEGKITQAQVQTDCQNQVQAAANATVGGVTVGSDTDADHTFVQNTCAFANPTQGIDYNAGDTGWVNGTAQAKISGDTACAVAEVTAAASISTPQLCSEAPSAVAAAAAPSVAAPSAAEQQTITNSVQSGHESDPLVFNLSGGSNISDSNQKVTADIDGKEQTVNNISSNEGVLKLNGQILGDKTDLSSLGITQKPTSAQDALNLIAQKAYSEGLISSPTHLTANDLQVLNKKFGLSVGVGSLNNQGESFAAAGINGLNLSTAASQNTNNFDGNGNTLASNGTMATLANGAQGGVGDIWYQTP